MEEVPAAGRHRFGCSDGVSKRKRPGSAALEAVPTPLIRRFPSEPLRATLATRAREKLKGWVPPAYGSAAARAAAGPVDRYRRQREQRRPGGGCSGASRRQAVRGLEGDQVGFGLRVEGAGRFLSGDRAG